MRKVLVLQHVAHEILGTFNPLLKARGFRVRYINFERQPDSIPPIERYNGLVILGGSMGVYQKDQFPHLRAELAAIELALKRDIPIFGICLGSQLLAQVLGSQVHRHKNLEKEIGWYDLDVFAEGLADPLFSHFQPREKIFQWHSDTFEVPKTAVHLAKTELFPSQVFRYGNKVYGLQCHLEVDQATVHRWLKVPGNLKELEESNGRFQVETIAADTHKWLARSKSLSQVTFNRFLDLFGLPPRGELLGSEHAKP